jgi:hypothetical protein
MKKQTKLIENVMERLLREARADADLGDVEFSPIRSDGVPTDEPNTPFEDLVLDQIGNWVAGDGDLKGPGGADDLATLMRHPTYSRFFKEATPGETLYRGVAMTREQLAGILGRDPKKLPRRGSATGTFTAGPRRGAAGASWSYDDEQAEYFAEAAVESSQRQGCVVFAASVDDNPGALLDLRWMLQRILRSPFLRRFIEEAEVVALRPLRVASLRWWDLPR